MELAFFRQVAIPVSLGWSRREIAHELKISASSLRLLCDFVTSTVSPTALERLLSNEQPEC